MERPSGYLWQDSSSAASTAAGLSSRIRGVSSRRKWDAPFFHIRLMTDFLFRLCIFRARTSQPTRFSHRPSSQNLGTRLSASSSCFCHLRSSTPSLESFHSFVEASCGLSSRPHFFERSATSSNPVAWAALGIFLSGVVSLTTLFFSMSQDILSHDGDCKQSIMESGRRIGL